MWTSIIALVLLGFILGCAPPVGTKLVDEDRRATTLVRALDAALNAHDSDAVVGMLTQNAVIQQDRQPQTPDQIRGWVEELIRQQIRVDLVDQPFVSPVVTPRTGTAVTWPARLDMLSYRGLGLAYVPAMVRVTVIDGLVAFLSIRPDDDWNPSLDRTALT